MSARKNPTGDIHAGHQEVEVERIDQERERPYYAPLVDIYEEGEDLVLTADMPGVASGSTEVTFENGVLAINGRTTGSGVEGLNRLYQEYVPGDYHRCFTLSEEIDPSKITARIREGVLTVRLPKAERARTRRIQVK